TVEVVGHHLPRRVLAGVVARVSRLESLRFGGGLLVGLIGHAWGRLLSGQSPARGRFAHGRKVTRATRVTDVGSYHPPFARRGGTRGGRGRARRTDRRPESPTTRARRASRRRWRGDAVRAVCSTTCGAR